MPTPTPTPRGIICQFHGYRVVEGEPNVCPACERVWVTRPTGQSAVPDSWYLPDEPSPPRFSREVAFEIAIGVKPAAKPNQSHRLAEHEREYGT